MSIAEGPIVILGGGQCAAAAAATLRHEGFGGEVVIVGAEPEAPYERPPLSKGYLLGETDAEQLTIRPAEWYAAQAVTLRLGTEAVSLDTRRRLITLSDGDTLSYHRLLIATGGTPRRLRGVDSERVLALRDRADADRVAQSLRSGEPLVILGGGFIGCEVASTARALGAQVTILEMQENPLQIALGSRTAQIVSRIHADAGVALRTGERVTSVTDVGDGLLITTDRGRLECSRLLVAIGLDPCTGLLADTPVDCRDGVLVDARCATNVDGIFAAGDVARHHHPTFGRHVRVEHYDNALRQGAAAARAMLGDRTPYADPHWFWSDQHGHNLQSVGVASGCDQEIVRGDPEAREFSVFSLREGTVRAVFGLDRGRDVTVGRRMVASGFRPDPELLRDPDADLRRMMSPRSRPRRTGSPAATAGAPLP